MNRSATLATVGLCWFAAQLLLPADGVAWTTESRIRMADFALRIAPPDLTRQIERHHSSYHAGIRAAAERDPSIDSPVRVDSAAIVKAEVEQAIQSITDYRPFREIVFRLGVVAYWVAGANNPIASSASGDSRPAYWEDYLRYLESATQRSSVLYYSTGRRFESASELEALLQAAVSRGRTMATQVAGEYARIGSLEGSRTFDDKSTAFGVGALAFSHGVSDIAGVLRYIWLAAGGADTLQLPPLDDYHLILVGRGDRAD